MALKSILAPHLRRNVVFGRKHPTPEAAAKVVKLGTYLKPEIAAPPAGVDYSLKALPCLSLVMLNDQLGDCTCAGACHCVGIWTGNAGKLFIATNDEVLELYESCGGYKPGDPSTDQGCDEVTVLDYLSNTGFPDGSKLAGYVSVDATNQTEVMQAAFLFGSLYFGVDLPDSWISPFPSVNGFTWDADQPDPSNGHCIVGTGYNDQGIQIDSWGLLGTITWAGVASLCTPGAGGALYALLSPDWIDQATAKAPSGFDFATLTADLQAMAAASRGGISQNQ